MLCHPWIVRRSQEEIFQSEINLMIWYTTAHPHYEPSLSLFIAVLTRRMGKRGEYDSQSINSNISFKRHFSSFTRVAFINFQLLFPLVLWITAGVFSTSQWCREHRLYVQSTLHDSLTYCECYERTPRPANSPPSYSFSTIEHNNFISASWQINSFFFLPRIPWSNFI